MTFTHLLQVALKNLFNPYDNKQVFNIPIRVCKQGLWRSRAPIPNQLPHCRNFRESGYRFILKQLGVSRDAIHKLGVGVRVACQQLIDCGIGTEPLPCLGRLQIGLQVLGDRPFEACNDLRLLPRVVNKQGECSLIGRQIKMKQLRHLLLILDIVPTKGRGSTFHVSTW